jgi:hypothetical protein
MSKGFWLLTLPTFAESRQFQLADECGKGASAGFAETVALVPPTSVGRAPLSEGKYANKGLYNR